MKRLITIWAIILIIAFILWPKTAHEAGVETVEAIEPEAVLVEEGPKLSHAQDTWIRALEWCESNGRPEAINEVDLDGTSSYGAFQFKPSTLSYFGGKYGIEVEGLLMDRDTQYEVVSQMVLHRDEIRWDQQFPWCVKKLGYPPKNEYNVSITN